MKQEQQITRAISFSCFFEYFDIFTNNNIRNEYNMYIVQLHKIVPFRFFISFAIKVVVVALQKILFEKRIGLVLKIFNNF